MGESGRREQAGPTCGDSGGTLGEGLEPRVIRDERHVKFVRRSHYEGAQADGARVREVKYLLRRRAHFQEGVGSSVVRNKCGFLQIQSVRIDIT